MNRRNFLKAAVMGGVGCTVPDLMAGFTDYRALVCIYLAGGNDSFNMLIPTGSDNHGRYINMKGDLGVGLDGVMPINPLALNRYSVGFHPALPVFKDFFDSKKLAVISNVGVLDKPIHHNGLVLQNPVFPKRLFSHNDQQSFWMGGVRGGQGGELGWGGQLMDFSRATGALVGSYSLDGLNYFQAANTVNTFTLSSGGTVPFVNFPQQGGAAITHRINVMTDMLAASNSGLESEYASRFSAAEQSASSVKEALGNVTTNVATPAGNILASKLEKVADLISQRSFLNQNRQIFFVKMGGWDTHDRQNKTHPLLLKELNDAMAYFDKRLMGMGEYNNVTSFTQSEFGRTFTSNGDGTDHGWGGASVCNGWRSKRW